MTDDVEFPVNQDIRISTLRQFMNCAVTNRQTQDNYITTLVHVCDSAYI